MIILLLSNSKTGQMISTVKVMEYYDETNEWRLCIVQINGTGLPQRGTVGFVISPEIAGSRVARKRLLVGVGDLSPSNNSSSRLHES